MKNKIKKAAGYTLIELMVVIAFLSSIVCSGVAVYIAWHFIQKLW